MAMDSTDHGLAFYVQFARNLTGNECLKLNLLM